MKDTDDPPKNNRPSIHLNLEDWLPYLEDAHISVADKIALIETLWSIILGFVDLGWDLETSENTSGQTLDLTAVLNAAVVNSKDAPKSESEEE